ncbi:MAG: phage holin family protein [Sphingomonas sp.]|uniref:phage holin family protein n=1 Tax=Sphingomonas sp. TaxID=28214 RepID=UPI001AC8011D|nr:phage holin family protein [Sphingomonas sp.]MBN8807256.1 phage holin family protein [Sphingomonas sp.]
MDGGPSPEESIGSLVGRLVDEGKQYARAEVDLYRAKLAPRLGEARNAAILAIAALVLAQALLVALLVGLVMTLAPRVGPGWATTIVVVVGLLIVALLGWIAFVEARRAFSSDRDAGR